MTKIRNIVAVLLACNVPLQKAFVQQQQQHHTRTRRKTRPFVRHQFVLFQADSCAELVDPASITQIGGFPGIALKFDRDGTLVYPPPADDDGIARTSVVAEWAKEHHLTDVWVTAHGWLTSREDAIDRYNEQFERVWNQAEGRLDGRQLGVIGITWPAKQYSCSMQQHGGGGDAEIILSEIDDMKEDFEDMNLVLEAVRTVIEGIVNLKKSLETQDDDVEAARQALRDALQEMMGSMKELLDDSANAVRDGVIDHTERRLLASDLKGLADETVGFYNVLQSSAPPVLRKWLDDLLGSIASLLDYTTYTKMMRRSEALGRLSLAPILGDLRNELPDMRIHLVGNSFGALLVSAAANASTPHSYASMALLQGAFSHNAFAGTLPSALSGVPMLEELDKSPGQYRRVIDEKTVAGPIVVTHTKNDNLLKIPYALAARIQGNTGLALPYMMMEELQLGLGGPEDKYGAIGSNGAINLDEVQCSTLRPSAPGTRRTYNLDAGKITNMEASETIQEHTDVRNEHIADLLVEVVKSTN